VDLQEKTDALAACDVLCLPSSQESFGGVLVEAWAMKKPVIGSNIPALREIITDDSDGFIVDPTPVQIAERITYLLDHPDIARLMGEKGYQKVNRYYTWDRLARKTEEIYSEVLSQT